MSERRRWRATSAIDRGVEEIEEIRRKLTEDGNPELEAEIAKVGYKIF